MKNKIPIILIIIGISLIVASSIMIITKNNKMSEDNPPSDKPEKKKKETIVFDGWVFTLPEGWTKNDEKTDESDGINILFNKTTSKVTSYNGAVFNIQKNASTGLKKEELFKDTSFFEEAIHFGYKDTVKVLNGKVITHKDKPVLVYECEYTERENSKSMFIYMPADDEYFYDIKFYSSKIVDDKEVMFYNYDDLLLFLDFLNTGKKQ